MEVANFVYFIILAKRLPFNLDTKSEDLAVLINEAHSKKYCLQNKLQTIFMILDLLISVQAIKIKYHISRVYDTNRFSLWVFCSVCI